MTGRRAEYANLLSPKVKADPTLSISEVFGGYPLKAIRRERSTHGGALVVVDDPGHFFTGEQVQALATVIASHLPIA
ncbi:hypothetical protein [Rhodococcus marinonascens]|uniref:hypothetical protein n=1 Tax=Rhodococcus marinonascens TaxID=38311 RepID=UPI0009346345|nr:hypothetical protein [Rhodococcus marinonascens]